MPNKWKEHNLLWSWTTVGKTIALSAWLCYMIIFRCVLLIIQPYIVFPQLLGSETRVIGCIQYMWFVANELKHAETDPSSFKGNDVCPSIPTPGYAEHYVWMGLLCDLNEADTNPRRTAVCSLHADGYLSRKQPFFSVGCNQCSAQWAPLRVIKDAECV